MKFLCERCGTRYSIADDKVRQKILKIRCKSCDNVITLRDSAVSDAPAESSTQGVSRPAPAAAPRPAPVPVRPAVVAASAPSLPTPPRAAVAPPERPEWHMAVDGQQKGPFTKSQLATAILALKAGVEVFVWKDGLDGWKEPTAVPEIERALTQAKQSRSLPPPRVPTALSLPVPAKSLASLASTATRTSSSVGVPSRAPSASVGDHLSSFDEGEATQIQPLSAVMMGDLANQDDLVSDDDDDKTPVANLVSGLGVQVEAGSAHNNGSNGFGNAHAMAAAPAARPPLDLFSDAPSTPFFPPPTANAPVPGRSPALIGPGMSMGGESGISQLMGLGGRVSRRPWLKYVAGAGAVLLLGGAIVMAVVGGGSSTSSSEMQKAGERTIEPGNQTPEQLERAAAAEAKKWFPDQVESGKVAHIGGAPGQKPAVVGGKKTGLGGKVAPFDPLAPPPLAPPPGGFVDPNTATPERKVDFGVAERRAVATKKAVSNAPAVDQASIGNVVRRKENQDAVKLCYNRVLRRTGSQAGGRIEVIVGIGISGRVKSVNLTSPAALNAVHDCLKQAVNRWHFPASPEDYETGFTLVLSGS